MPKSEYIPNKERAADLVELLRLIRYEVLEDPSAAIRMINDIIDKVEP